MIKNSIALVIYNKDRRRLLIVKRPPEDDKLANVWGLPAGSLKNGETYEDAVIRAGREKLGVELKIIRKIAEGDMDRDDYTLHMKEYEAEIVKGEPNVPQLIAGVTQYVQWKWGESTELIEAAGKGSLCCRLYLSQDFPHLFQDTSLGATQCRFELLDSPPPHNLISNVHLVPFIGNQCLVIRLSNGDWEIPGGTLEPNEGYLEAIRRELLEEAGARLISFQLLGVWRCHSSATKPYRPHLPHPEFYVFVGYGEVELVGKPKNPASGEQVVAVECMSVEEASRRFVSIGRHDLAELYRLAAMVREIRNKMNP
jgi:ADP-ribose pyrophosphatase YjhB (NUDIX family)